MRKFAVTLTPIAALFLASLALAAWNPTPMSSSSVQETALSNQMSACTVPVDMSLSSLSEEDIMCPMVMPMQSSTTNGQVSLTPMSAEQSMPANAKMLTILVPVSITQVNGRQVLDAKIDSSLANSVVLMSMSCGGQNVMQPMKLTPAANNVILLVPLSPTTITQPASVPLYMEGEMKMVPVDEQASTSGLTVEADAQQKTKVKCPR